MDGKPVSGAKGGNRGRGHGLKVAVRLGTTKLHITGTLRVAGTSVRVRRSTGLDISSPQAWEAAEALRIKVEAELLDQAVYGRPPPVLLATIAAHYIKAVGPGPADLRNLNELLDAFGKRPVAEISRGDIEAYYRSRFADAKPQTQRRHENTMHALLTFATKKGHLPATPYWERTKVPHKKGDSVMKRYLPGEGELLVDCAAPHLRPLFATLLVTGARVGQTIHLKKEHFVLVPGRGRIHFPETKNGNAYTRPLHDYAVNMLTEWLEQRRDRFPEMFLTHRRTPFKPRIGGGGIIQHSFRTARDRCVARLQAMGLDDRARVIAQATPHWFRHSFANTLRQDHRLDARTIAEAGMWESVALVNDTYIADVPAHVEEAMKGMVFGLQFSKKNQTSIR
ncbi:tyrosine-type recombinase/integrase [Pelagibius sp.]|uniref:tyrosine-type recombinase/integrase n=1 Tax=Pelagibius sp. TaxID=1931238 RepID=UPI003BAEEF29